MRILIIPDKFKGSISSAEAIYEIKKICNQVLPDSTCEGIAVSDGGEGSLLSLREVLKAEEVHCEVQDGLGRQVNAWYLRKGSTAFLETSQSCGLVLLGEGERNPLYTNTFGVGMMIGHAIHHGCTDIHLFLGGSSTHDAGTGMAAALGFAFLDTEGQRFIPAGATLDKIKYIIRTPETEILERITFRAWSDVNVPLTGARGAIMFAGQKGATASDIQILEKGTSHISQLLVSMFPDQYLPDLQGGGAAGGLGAGAAAFLGAVIGSGWSFISNIHQLEQKIAESDLIITGEGKLDSQTLEGKCVGCIAELCKKHDKPCLIFCGISEIQSNEWEILGKPSIYPLHQKGETIEESIDNARFRLRNTVRIALDRF